MCRLTEQNSEKYMKRLIGMTDMEDTLKRLGKLMKEEARMAVAGNLKVMDAVDECEGTKWGCLITEALSQRRSRDVRSSEMRGQPFNRTGKIRRA